jgi:hypothetical protein
MPRDRQGDFAVRYALTVPKADVTNADGRDDSSSSASPIHGHTALNRRPRIPRRLRSKPSTIAIGRVHKIGDGALTRLEATEGQDKKTITCGAMCASRLGIL